MQFVRDRTIFDTETAELIFAGPVDMGLGPGVTTVGKLYRTPKGKLFMTTAELGEPCEEVHVAFDVIENEHIDSIVSWLEKNDAPASVYEAAGVAIEQR